MANLLRHNHTYASYASALASLDRVARTANLEVENLRYIIAANPEGRFAPVVLLNQKDLSDADVVRIFALTPKTPISVIG